MIGVVGGHPIDSGDYRGVAPEPGVVQHPDGNEMHAFGDPVRGPSNRAGHMGAVAVAVRRSTVRSDRIVAGHGPATELGVSREDPGIEDVGVYSGSVFVVVVGSAQRLRACWSIRSSPQEGGLGCVVTAWAI